MRAASWLPLAGALLTLLAWLAAWQLPWLEVAGAQPSLRRADLLASQVPYERMLVAWPLLALPMAASALALLAWAGRRGLPPPWPIAAAAVAAFCGVIPLVAGARLVGFATVRAMDPGNAVVQPGPAAVAVALAGAGCVAAAMWMLRRHAVDVPASALAAGATLVAMPFLPFGRTADGTLFYDELTLAAAASAGGLLGPPAQALHWLRGALWASVLAGALVAALEPRGLPRVGAWRRAALAGGPAAAVALLGLFLVRWAAIDGLGLPWNPVAFLGVLATATLAAWPLFSWVQRSAGASNEGSP